MDKDEIIKKAGDAKYISGIYNYCDRWCERCPLTARCLNYSCTEEEESDSPENHDLNNKAFWDKLSNVFETTLEMLKDMAKEQNIDFDSVDTEADERREKQKRQEAESHPLAKASMSYANTVAGWLKSQGEVFERKGHDLIRELELDLPNNDPNAQAADITDCVEVVKWYQFQIHVKLMRALTNEDIPGLVEEGFPSDADGSAKVALMGLDRSIAAYSRLREHFPEQEDNILNILITLDRIRRGTEEEFPKARAFVRPGFDEMPEAMTTGPSCSTDHRSQGHETTGQGS